MDPAIIGDASNMRDRTLNQSVTMARAEQPEVGEAVLGRRERPSAQGGCDRCRVVEPQRAAPVACALVQASSAARKIASAANVPANHTMLRAVARSVT